MVLSRRLDWRWIGLKTLAHLLALLPAAVMLYRALNDRLGADPIAALTHQTGDWAIRLLLLSLAMTPLRKLLGQAWPIRFRHLIGLYAFFYASLHFSVYLFLDLGAGYWSQIAADILKRPFITVGFAAWLLLLPTAYTLSQVFVPCSVNIPKKYKILREPKKYKDNRTTGDADENAIVEVLDEENTVIQIGERKL